MSFRIWKIMLQCIACYLFAGWGFIVYADNQDYNSSGGEWKQNGSSYTHEKATFSEFRYSSEDNSTNTYKYEVVPPAGWSFFALKTTFSGGTKIADPTATYSGIKKISSATNNPASFVLSMGGELTKPGSGNDNGNENGTVTWSASAKSDFFYISPHTIITVFNGTQKIFSAKSSESTGNIPSNWTASPTWTASTNPTVAAYSPLNGKESITIGNGGNWNPPGESYTVTASATINQKSRTAQANLKIIRLTFLTPSSGVLTLNLSIQVTPADMADKIKDGCRFSVGNIAGSTMAWHADNPNGKPTVNNGKLEATVTFIGLPANNSSFGKKTAQISYSGTYGSATVTQDYEVFFPRDATNHLACPSCAGCPNWFYYWRQIYPGGNVVYSAFSGFGETVGMTNWSYNIPQNKILIKIGNAHPSEFQSYGIGKKCSGIDRLIMTIIHERKHVDQISRADALLSTSGNDSFRYGWSWNVATHNHWTKGADGKWGVANVDDDGNGTIDDAASIPPFEPGHGDDVNLSDPIWANKPTSWAWITSAPYNSIKSPIEREAIKAADDAMSENDYARSDWGSPGKNHKTLNKWND